MTEDSSFPGSPKRRRDVRNAPVDTGLEPVIPRKPKPQASGIPRVRSGTMTPVRDQIAPKGDGTGHIPMPKPGYRVKFARPRRAKHKQPPTATRRSDEGSGAAFAPALKRSSAIA